MSKLYADVITFCRSNLSVLKFWYHGGPRNNASGMPRVDHTVNVEKPWLEQLRQRVPLSSGP